MTTMTEAGYKREQAKKKKAAALKAKAKKKAPAKAKEKALGSCAKVRQIADKMPNAEPAEVYAKCEAAGIHARTTRAEFANWCKDKYGKTPSKRFAAKATPQRGKKKATLKRKAA